MMNTRGSNLSRRELLDPRRFRVIVATPDVVGERMAGPGIRAAWLARELSEVADVTLVARCEAGASLDGIFALPPPCLPRLVARGSAEATRAMDAADVLVGQPARGFVRRHRGQRVVYDLFDPLVLELRELYGPRPSVRQCVHLAAEWARLFYALRHADLLMSAVPRQAEFYRKLQSSEVPWIEVPFGIDPAEIDRSARSPGRTVLWGGGVWEWLDPRTAVDAVVRLNGEGTRCRLLFLGMARPNPHETDGPRESRFETLVASGSPWIDVNPGWIPYRERLSWLRSAKATIMLHRPTPEAWYAVRTRLFDAIAAAVPVIATEGGFAADLVRSEGLGIVVPAGDVTAVAAAIRRLMDDEAFHAVCVQNLERIRPRFAWSVVARPLVDAVTRWQTP